MKTKDFLEGGNWKEKGYLWKMYFIVPEIRRTFCESIVGTPQKSIKVSFPTGFCFVSNNIYVNVNFKLLGFGLGLEIQSRS